MSTGIREGEQVSEYGRAVLRERARLALQDPLGELEAVRPLSWEQALLLWHDNQPVPVTLGRPTTWQGPSPLDSLLPPGRSRAVVRCPAHQDRLGSLSVTRTADRLLVHCFAGCTFDEIRQAIAA